MDCVTAQGLISDAMDRSPVDAGALGEAKSHCLGCPTCSVFVRTLVLVKNTPLPQPPADLVDRVMEAVRVESILAERRAAAAEAAEAIAAMSAADAANSAAADAAAATESADTQRVEAATGTESAGSPRAVFDSLRHWASGLSRRELVTWASAAAVFIAALGLAANAGIRVMTTQPGTFSEQAAVTSTDAGAQKELAAPVATESADAAAGSSVSAASPASVITVSGVVFKLSGPSTIATATLKAAGSTTSALGSGLSPTSHSVFTGDDPERVYVTDEATHQQFAFDRVIRVYGGVNYQLVSADVNDFGQWPSLPSQIPAPASEDGSPAFTPLTTDPSGTRIFRLATSGAESGIAVAPGTSPGDPAAGNPNWTWWTPVR